MHWVRHTRTSAYHLYRSAHKSDSATSFSRAVPDPVLAGAIIGETTHDFDVGNRLNDKRQRSRAAWNSTAQRVHAHVCSCVCAYVRRQSWLNHSLRSGRENARDNYRSLACYVIWICNQYSREEVRSIGSLPPPLILPAFSYWKPLIVIIVIN